MSIFVQHGQMDCFQLDYGINTMCLLFIDIFMSGYCDKAQSLARYVLLKLSSKPVPVPLVESSKIVTRLSLNDCEFLRQKTKTFLFDADSGLVPIGYGTIYDSIW